MKDARFLTLVENKILECLESGPKTRAFILEAVHNIFFNGVGYDEKCLSDRELRNIVSDMVLSGRALIGTDPEHGYYLIETEEQFEDAYACLSKKAYALFQRARRLKMEYKAKFGRYFQGTFNFDK